MEHLGGTELARKHQRPKGYRCTEKGTGGVGGNEGFNRGINTREGSYNPQDSEFSVASARGRVRGGAGEGGVGANTDRSRDCLIHRSEGEQEKLRGK